MSQQLFTPITVGPLRIRNRLWVAPMCQYVADDEDGVPTAWHLVHLGAFARSAVGLVMTEATAVAPEGRITPQDLGLWNDTQGDAFRPIVDFIHSQGATAAIQLAHAGRKGSVFRPWDARTGTVPHEDGGWQTVGPSDAAYPGFSTPRALDVPAIRRIVDEFASAALRAVRAGFDVLEIHAAHGYLIHQFLSPISNRRTDSYGGSLANRARFLLDVIDAIRGTAGEDVPIIVRFSATDWVENGWTLADTVTVARWAKDHGVDAFDLSSGGSTPDAEIPAGPGYQVPFATAVRAATRLPTIGVGMIDSPRQAEQIVATGLADIVMAGREFLRDPHFALRAAAALRADLPYAPQPYHRAPISA